ncbi:MAG TPA: c-type cytochrome [Bryobacteraceae bacterium]|nr:c-type cytochrome [Bryobacteraceae bacterium]
MQRLHLTLFAGALAMATAGLLPAQPAEVKMAEQAFKNITQLKGTPADQLVPAMQFISSSLGVECNFCHVQGKMDADEKPQKKVAREMMAMTAAINTNAFHGQRQVTCYSCHHGSQRPTNTPPVLDSDAPQRTEARPAAPAGTAPTAADILDKYVAALGGADAIKKINSRVMKGSIHAGGSDTPIELFTKAPNKRISISHMGDRESITAFDGTVGWLGSTGRPPREMSPAESEAAGLDAEFALALRLKEMFQQLRPGRPEEINGVQCVSLFGTRPGKPPVRFYFDAKTGLLQRLVRYGETPMGRNPTQIDYADYREVDGVKIPFRWTLSRPNGRFTIQIAEVKANVPVDDARFAKPSGEVK